MLHGCGGVRDAGEASGTGRALAWERGRQAGEQMACTSPTSAAGRPESETGCEGRCGRGRMSHASMDLPGELVVSKDSILERFKLFCCRGGGIGGLLTV